MPRSRGHSAAAASAVVSKVFPLILSCSACLAYIDFVAGKSLLPRVAGANRQR
ncbi:uncharacterized protein L969DRAFT_74361 [Mixia osmundae IAM 14324]|uniref:Uncharacterized protein n=1 Tax=Mixia osmundae (strain CBS 9802 / IAM 14324 / JCM 22182 / KY 12970) TaxID=764103 RepID=G7E3B7_MIXOS|nr:uncharacterized protein L969DRAFT_74361 [Mixia osmundae IAM 14324]KEI39314.1 hypothetical protein L969DRAFT_74361 [Mixia osmundae IAM 14324]GAA97327.1 hypothetical protein E5Q_04005 [Mixia osmundae IAM 14324]